MNQHISKRCLLAFSLCAASIPAPASAQYLGGFFLGMPELQAKEMLGGDVPLIEGNRQQGGRVYSGKEFGIRICKGKVYAINRNQPATLIDFAREHSRLADQYGHEGQASVHLSETTFTVVTIRVEWPLTNGAEHELEFSSIGGTPPQKAERITYLAPCLDPPKDDDLTKD